MQHRFLAAGDAVIGPEDLRAIRQFDRFVGMRAGMRAGKGGMVWLVPILRRERMREAGRQTLMIGTIASPSGTGKPPPGMKVGCTSIRPKIVVEGSISIASPLVRGTGVPYCNA